MKKIEKRALLCLLLAAALLLGSGLFVFRFVKNGGRWVSFAATRHLYNRQGQLSVGRVLDRDGDVLSWTEEDGTRRWYDNSTVRKATLHAVGDAQGNIGTGALVAFADQLSGYNLLTGAYSPLGAGNDLYLTLDARYNYIAYEALAGRKGAVGVYNYETGEVLCMVSTPAFDPLYPPSAEEMEGNDAYDGVYLNRFLSGQQVYSRDDDIQFCMVVKTSMDTSAPESITKLHLKPTDTIDDIYEKLNKGIASIQGQAIGGSDFDKTAKFLSFIPGVLFKFVVWLLKTIDYFGFLPKFLLEVSPFHASIFFTSMGSLGIPPIVHHLYDFGNMPVFVAFGCKYHKNEVLDDGTVVRRKYIDYTVNTDERICDGFYYATTLKHLKRLLSHPEQLDKPAPVVNHDIE